MKKDDIVIIYEDPLTEKNPEGKAKLIKKIIDTRQGNGNQEYWTVRFLSDNFICDRFISIK